MEITQKIIEYCGLKPENLELTEIGNDPSFVFENDPNFQTVALYDSDGNTIFVNSWLECANYVNGGWVNDMNLFINEERMFFFTIMICSAIGYFARKYFVKRYSKL